jgi:hypothetical protein
MDAVGRPAPSYTVRVWVGTNARSVAVTRSVPGVPVVW